MSERSPENLLLYLPKQQEQEIRDLLTRIHHRGLPEQHQRPHITLTFAQHMHPHVLNRAQELLPPLLPATFQRRGAVVFGTKRKQTIAWLLETTDELEAAARELNALNPEGRGNRWTPHLTLGLRLQREDVPEFLRALDEETSPHLRELTAEYAAHWVPRTSTLTRIE